VRTPTDPAWLSSVRVAAIVAAIGGGASAAWTLRVMSRALPDLVLESPWLEIVLFACTALLTARAFYLCLGSDSPGTWAIRCVQYGAINGIVCTVVFFPFTSHRSDALAIICCVSPFIAVLGGLLGLAFFCVYFPVLALARRMHTKPSLDIASRMVPWCAGWLTAIGFVLTFGRSPQLVLASACAIVASAIASWGFVADRRRRAFLAGVKDTSLRFTNEPTEGVLPFVGGRVERTLVEQRAGDHGPFRSAAIEEPHATFSADLSRERRAISLRSVVCVALGLADLALVATIVTFALRSR
jgi:hypothetical protein